jgi:hypothetical protein
VASTNLSFYLGSVIFCRSQNLHQQLAAMAASRMSAVSIAAVVVLALAGAASGQSTKDTLQDPRNVGSCTNQFNSIINNYYGSDPTCARLVTTALNTTVTSQCPPTDPGSPTHYCMNKDGNQVGHQYTHGATA